MGLKQSTSKAAAKPREAAAPSGSQTLLRGLDVLEAAAGGVIGLADLAERLELTRSTAHRLASVLVERRYLAFAPREGYTLGPKLLELGFSARQQMNIIRIAAPHLEALSVATEDTVHLGVQEGALALYLDKIPGRRRVEIGSRVGERQPLTTTGLGKALILDESEERWHELFMADLGARATENAFRIWLKRMRAYARDGHAFDLEENEDRIRCVSAPIREAGGRIAASISVSSAAQYMSDSRMEQLAKEVKATTAAISRELGWRGDPPRA
ncbi:IclR family transcriptional regulator [Nevskia soli]|uniref:IclR family transcriptional regulator n=1 Tax=Nevskia soli TaxID=418856 RepID=UPI0004A73967|nr:IclR family transcriptional regulator [Nevskia soli]